VCQPPLDYIDQLCRLVHLSKIYMIHLLVIRPKSRPSSLLVPSLFYILFSRISLSINSHADVTVPKGIHNILLRQLDATQDGLDLVVLGLSSAMLSRSPGGYYCMTENKDERMSYQKNCIDTTIIFWIVGNLCVFSKYDLTACCDKPKLGDVDLNDGAFCHDAQLCVHG